MPTIPLLSFAEKVEPIVRLCHTIIKRHGGNTAPPADGRGFYRGGYWFTSSRVEPDSEPDYALKILWTLKIAFAATDLEEARKYAWDAAQLLFDAHVVFKRKKTALHAAFLAGQAHTTRARESSRANAWQEEVSNRRFGSKRLKMLQIEEREGLHPGTVKKALQRRNARLKENTPPRKK
jgi:hypothetical protein